MVTDEAHRSIYGSWRPALEHFDAFHIGLTATPAQYIDRNTYQFFDCPDLVPDFSYPIEEAFENGYAPKVVLEATAEETLNYIDINDLIKHAYKKEDVEL